MKTNGMIALASAASLAVLAGCSGTTYGTGVSQERQLVSDMSAMVTLSRSKKQKIDYSARSGLVPAPKSGELPPPAETVQSQSAYFPQNPEEAEASLREEADREEEILRSGGQLSPQLQAAREEARRRNRVASLNSSFGDGDRKESYQEIVARQEEYKRRKAQREGEFSPKARRYLTQPPVAYRTPADTAPIGDPGEKEKDPNARKRSKNPIKNIFER